MFSYFQQALAASPAQGFDPLSLLPFLLIFVVFYFFLIRPQQKRMKEHQKMLSELRRGDKVLTTGGLFATIHRIIDEKEVILELDENIHVRASRAAISDVTRTQ